MGCSRCQADPRPKHFGDPRRCAFTDGGEFTPENWNCASIEAMLTREGMDDCVEFGDNESFEHTYVPEIGEHETGWIITSRYKTRGCTSSAIMVGDFYPPRPVTLELVERLLAYRVAMDAYTKENGE